MERRERQDRGREKKKNWSGSGNGEEEERKKGSRERGRESKSWRRKRKWRIIRGRKGRIASGHLKDSGEEVWVLVGPIRSPDECDHLDDLVDEEARQCGVVSEEVLGEEVAHLGPLGRVDRQPLVSHQVLGG